MGEHDDIERLRDVVEDEQPIVEREAQVWQLQIVRGCVGQMLGITDGVIGRIPHHAAGEWRQFGEPRRREGFHTASEFAQRVGGLECLDGVAPRDPHGGTEGLESHEGIGAEEAVAAHLLPADHALEQAAAVAGVDPGECRQRRQPIGEQPPVDRDEAKGLRQLDETTRIG